MPVVVDIVALWQLQLQLQLLLLLLCLIFATDKMYENGNKFVAAAKVYGHKRVNLSCN